MIRKTEISAPYATEDIVIEGISKSYGKKTVLKNISLSLPFGSCIGILGGNGSGKTTLLSILSGILSPDTGHFYVQHQDLFHKKELRRKLVGLIPQSNPLIEELSAWDNLRLWHPKKKLLAELEGGFLMHLQIDGFLHTQVRKLSGGMKKRLAIACAVAAKPRILLMDEPSAALDLICQEIIHNYIRTYTKAGGSILLVTHDAAELDLCDAHYILKDGQLIPYSYIQDIHDLISHL